MKIRRVGAELLRADRRKDGQTWRSYICFRNFANEPINFHGFIRTLNSSFRAVEREKYT